MENDISILHECQKIPENVVHWLQLLLKSFILIITSTAETTLEIVYQREMHVDFTGTCTPRNIHTYRQNCACIRFVFQATFLENALCNSRSQIYKENNFNLLLTGL